MLGMVIFKHHVKTLYRYTLSVNQIILRLLNSFDVIADLQYEVPEIE